MKRRFAYLFAINGEIVWSSETAQSLLGRVKTEDKKDVMQLIKMGPPGCHVKLSTGDMVFVTEQRSKDELTVADFTVGTSVTVKWRAGDMFAHDFTGTVKAIKNDSVLVEDQDGDCWDCSPSQLIHNS